MSRAITEGFCLFEFLSGTVWVSYWWCILSIIMFIAAVYDSAEREAYRWSRWGPESWASWNWVKQCVRFLGPSAFFLKPGSHKQHLLYYCYFGWWAET